MSCTATTYDEARGLARRLRRLHAGLDWRVVIYPPVFPGDRFRVVVE